MKASDMDEGYEPCCSLEIHKSVEDVAESPSLVLHIGKESNSKFCAVVITGNPGMIEFYEIFMLHLHKASKCHLQVMGISQAGKSTVLLSKYQEYRGYALNFFINHNHTSTSILCPN